jgi:prevent-host-death family protein
MNHTPKSSNITATRLQREVGRVLRRVARMGEHVTVEHNGFPIVVIVPLGDYAALVQNACQPNASSSEPATDEVEATPTAKAS